MLSPGSVLNGSALFVLETDQIKKSKHIENAEIIKDFSGNTTVQPIEIQESWIDDVKDTIVKSEFFTLSE